MKLLKHLPVFVLIVSSPLFLLSQTSPVLGYIPENAKLVIKINPVQLAMKMKLDEIVKSDMFGDMMKNVPEEKRNLLLSSSMQAIDLGQGLFVVVPQKTTDKKPGAIIYGTIKDTTEFANMIKNIFSGRKISKLGNSKMITDTLAAVAWNREVFVIISQPKSKSDATATKEIRANQATMMKQLVERCKSLLAKPPKALTNEHFTTLLNENGDLLLWMNNAATAQAQKNGKVPPVFTMLNKNLMQGNSFSANVITFENGKVTMRTKRFVPPSIDSAYRKFPVGNIDLDLLKKLPSGQPIVLGSFSFSPTMLNEMFKKTGMDKFIDSSSKGKVTSSDLLSSVRGTIGFAVIKAYEFGEDDSVTQAMNGLQVYLTGKISTAEKFKAFSDMVKKEMSDSTGAPAKKMKPFIFSNDSMFVVSVSPVAAQKFLSNSGENSTIENLIAPYKDYPSAFYLDLKTVFAFAMQTSKGKSPEEQQKLSEVAGKFDRIVSYGGRYENGAVSGTMNLELTNKDENSLRQFIDLAHLFYDIGNEKKKNKNN